MTHEFYQFTLVLQMASKTPKCDSNGVKIAIFSPKSQKSPSISIYSPKTQQYAQVGTAKDQDGHQVY